MVTDTTVKKMKKINRYLKIAAVCKIGYFLLFAVALGLLVGGSELSPIVDALLLGCLAVFIIGIICEVKAKE